MEVVSVEQDEGQVTPLHSPLQYMVIRVPGNMHRNDRDMLTLDVFFLLVVVWSFGV